MTAVLQDYFDKLRALMIRDMMMRFGRDNLGFVWSVLEPMILCTGVMGLWFFLKEPVIHGLPVIGYVLTGYMPLTLSRHLINSQIQIFSRNAQLLYHAPLRHRDIVLARLLLEFLSTTAALAIIYLTLLAVGLAEPVEDWGLLLAAWLLMGWFFAGIGLLIAAATEIYEAADKFIQPVQYLAIPLSGVFFMVDWLPSHFQHLISWVPTVHGYEMFRAGYFGGAVITHDNPLYLALWAGALTVLGLVVVEIVPDHLQA